MGSFIFIYDFFNIFTYISVILRYIYTHICQPFIIISIFHLSFEIFLL